ncbi:electron transfer flavoprotein subunit alpha/FixB family protein [Methylobacterium platani]|uniref:Electron transfer flavoprotein subunit alpha n=2 Tax=Methylobacterium platani TaxID=427683 RepID=A0A179RXY1_9HYPH|nr:electron transfer flavoprotein subunit alpha/FixB family protein [Methylobacterium platani]KMO16126.1 electron transfer flavoprotein subunit alpha [Methylobacterium platani JCM 14648]OAS15558.1 electron transfer flavoprotein subunit alpha [Methylobacterium platani]
MTRPRRDPRAERAAIQVAAGPRPRFDRSARAAGGRPRRDPRPERAGQRVPGASRPRYDLSQVVPAQALRGEVAVAAEARQPAAAKILVVEDPAFLVAVVPDAAGGRLSPHDRQVLGAARVLAGREGGILVVSVGPCEACGPAGADRHLALGEVGTDPDERAARVAAALAVASPRHVLFPESLDGGDLARRVAVRMGVPLFDNAEVVAAGGLVRPARGRRVEQRAAPGLLASVAPDAVADYAGPPREARPLAHDLPPAAEPASTILSVARIPADPATVPLSLAEFVASAGNGIRDLDTFRQLVAALHATPGASRVLCDAGLMPRHTQVGASGTVLAATCYFALGISGAPQHLQGVAGCEHVVAVNTDLHAAMIERAGLAIVQDAQAVMPALLRLLAREKQEAGEGS